MISLLLSWALSAGALLVASKLFRGVELEGDFADALWVSAGFSILAFLTSWFIFGVLGIATLGLGFIFHFITQLVTAAIVLKLTSALSSRFSIRGFAPALGTAILLAFAAELAHQIL